MTEFRFGGPIFIGGCPRSGTTMLGAMLANASGCVTTPESHFKHQLIAQCAVQSLTREQFLDFLANSNEIAFWELPFWLEHYPREITLDNLSTVLNQIVYRYYRSRVDQTEDTGQRLRRWVDHTPMNIEGFRSLLDLYPQAQLIHLVRDPRAIAASVFALPWGPNDPVALAGWWLHYVNAGLRLQYEFPDRILQIRYEDLLQDSKPTLTKVCQFLGLQFSPRLLSAQRYSPPQYSKSQHALVGKPPAAERATAWQEKLSARDQAYIELACGVLMRQLGYDSAVPAIRKPLGSTVMWYLGIIWRRAQGSLRRKALRRERSKLAKLIRSQQPFFAGVDAGGGNDSNSGCADGCGGSSEDMPYSTHKSTPPKKC